MKLTYRQVCRLFIDFLKENNALKRFKTNILTKDLYETTPPQSVYINPLKDEEIKNCFSNGFLTELINYAFLWSSTAEGENYWRKLHTMWTHKIRKMKIEIITEKLK